MKPYLHARSSARRFGGSPDDYLDIHNLLDSSKAALPDNRHRALTHNAWFIGTILERIFGVTIVNAEGREVSVRDIGEQHVLEDYGGRFIPTAQDFFGDVPLRPWMVGRGLPPSAPGPRGEAPNTRTGGDDPPRPTKRVYRFDQD